MIGHRKSKSAAAVFGLLALVALATGLGWAVEPSRLINADKDPNSWLSYNGTYQAWRYSSLGQINRSNVGNLKVAWIFQPGMPATEHGLEGDRKSTRLNSSHLVISYAVFCLKKKKKEENKTQQ